MTDIIERKKIEEDEELKAQPGETHMQAIPRVAGKLAKKAGLSVAQQDQTIETAATKPEAMAEKVVTNEMDRKQNKPVSTKDSFMEAFTHFLPQIGGMAIGGLLEGTEGAIAGGKQGAALGASLREHKLAKRQEERKDRQEDRKDKALELKQIKATEPDKLTAWQKAQLKMHEEGMDAREIEESRRREKLKLDEKKLGLSREKFGLSKQQVSQLSGKQVETLSNFNSVLASVDRINEKIPKIKSGPLAGRAQTLAQFADLAPKEFTAMKAETTNALAAYVKSISGAAVSELEAQRLQGIMPHVNDAPDVFEQKTKTFQRIVRDNKKIFAQAIATGQPLKAGTIKGLMEAETKFKSKGTSDSKKAKWSEDKRKRYEAWKAGRSK